MVIRSGNRLQSVLIALHSAPLMQVKRLSPKRPLNDGMAQQGAGNECTEMNAATQPPWITALCRSDAFDHAVQRIEVLETHISWVVLTGEFAYKIKKPLALGFLDFTHLADRKRFCEEELRLNRRFAPQLYLEVVAIRGSAASPRVFGSGDVIDYAVKMREFPQHALASRLLVDGAISSAMIDALAVKVSAFHGEAGCVARGSPYGTQESVIKPARENFERLALLVPDEEYRTQLAALRAWTDAEYEKHWTLFGERQTEGFVRECHGDLHLGNIVLIDGALVPFDCIEFNPSFRWIDVMNEVAFLVMDFMDRGYEAAGWRFLNAYLERTGDYAGLRLLRFYLVYRAMIRAKVHGIRAQQAADDPAERARLLAVCRDYVTLAVGFTRMPSPVLMAMHGLSGSGKTVVSQQLVERLGAIRLRSDVERKRQHQMPPGHRGDGQLDAGIYSEEATQVLYALMMRIACTVVESGYTVIIDAAFLKRWQRKRAMELARTCQVPLLIVACQSPTADLAARVDARAKADTDASDAGPKVLARQLEVVEQLEPDELAVSVSVDTRSRDLSGALGAIQARIAELRSRQASIQK